MDFIARMAYVCWTTVLVFLVTCIGTAEANRPHQSPGAPAALRIRPPPMTADPIAPDCYNFTYGNWRRQEFYSPNYPGIYLNNTNCVLYLEAPSGFRIQLDFRDQFTLEKSENCKYDFLEVRDGPFAYSPIIGRFCGPQFPPLIESTNRFLWLRFKTDDLLQYGGFRAIYSYHKDHTQNDGTSLSKVTSTVCRIPVKLGRDHPDGTLTSQEVPFGDVLDPNYPRKRPVDCTWEIYTDQGHAINLQTVKMNRKTATCDNSYLAVYQGTTLESDQKARICGEDKPEVMSVTSNRNRVFVRLYGNSLETKPDVEMVYSLVKIGSCMDGYLSCDDFCISRDMRCNGVPNCPDGRDERGCPRVVPRPRPGDRDPGGIVEDDLGSHDHVDVATGASAGAGAGGGGHYGRGGEKTDKPDAPKESDGGTKIPLHTIILGVIGGVLVTCVVFGLCIMCRSRRHEKRKRKTEELKMAERSKRSILEVPVSAGGSHPTHSLSRQGEGGRPSQKCQGQGPAQGSYMTFAHVSPNSAKDNPNRYSFTGTTLPGETTDVVEMSDSGLYRRYLNVEITPDELQADPTKVPQLYSQGVVLGMTHLPAPSSPGVVEGSVPYGVKYSPQPGQWSRGLIEDPAVTYSYTSSLPRPTPFLGVSKPFPAHNAESKYLKSMQALKSMDNEIMKENPAA